ncbi:MAG: hypothetical protein AB7U73_23415 [Pirellulales bacterium]
MRIREGVNGEPISARLRQLAVSDQRWAEHYARLVELVALLEALPPDELFGAEIIERRPPALLIVGTRGRAVTVRPDHYDGRAAVESPLHFRIRIDRGPGTIADETRIVEPAAAAARVRQELFA